MFKRLPDVAGDRVEIVVEGHPALARRGDTVAAALLACGVPASRTTAVSGAARGPYCMMGICFDCLVTIDGRPNQQGCMIRVREGMRIDMQQGARRIAP
jgi:predicted molibdopterin-dependent oxidoreductase YjgC